MLSRRVLAVLAWWRVDLDDTNWGRITTRWVLLDCQLEEALRLDSQETS